MSIKKIFALFRSDKISDLIKTTYKVIYSLDKILASVVEITTKFSIDIKYLNKVIEYVGAAQSAIKTVAEYLGIELDGEYIAELEMAIDASAKKLSNARGKKSEPKTLGDVLSGYSAAFEVIK